MSNHWPSGSYRVFISYARDDAHEVALSLRDNLADAGHDAWMDVAEIAAGASWARDIEEAIEYCDIVLALLSHGSYVSDICRSEQLRALRKNKRVIPVLVQPDADRPLHLENLNYVDFSEPSHYESLFSDLLSYIETGYIPRHTIPMESFASKPLIFPPPKAPRSDKHLHKRDTRAFRRYLADLREESWLGERHWWTYALFYYADVCEVAEVLTKGRLDAPANSMENLEGSRRSRVWDKFVRLNFRPRTPDLFGQEGILPESERRFGHCPIPVYLLFDLEPIMTLVDTRFSAGDVMPIGATYKSAVSFRDLPFDLIYHDGPFSRHERDEILTARRAQALLPDSLDLSYLRHIWCRSPAEYETLRTLMAEPVWERFEDRVTTRTDYELFHRHRRFVYRAGMAREGAHFVFNPCANSGSDECGPFNIRAELVAPDGEHYELDLGEFVPEDELALDLTSLNLNAYELRLYLDDALAYAGCFTSGGTQGE
jgi:hypothetical protein